MAEDYGVDRKTLRKAIGLLSEEGILNCMQGKGTYIAKPQIPYQVEMLDDLEQMILRNGMKPSTRVLYTESRKAGRKYAALLEVEEETRIFRMLRLRSGNGEHVGRRGTWAGKESEGMRHCGASPRRYKGSMKSKYFLSCHVYKIERAPASHKLVIRFIKYSKI